MALFSLFIPHLLQVEGGFQKMPQDSGNYNSIGQLVGTNWGISAPVYERWIKRVPSELDMRNMPKAVALQIYESLYWNAVNASRIKSQSVANIIVDHAVNAGVASAGRLTQRVLNRDFEKKLSVDGVIGPKSIEAINSVNPKTLHQKIKDERESFYHQIGGVFLNGWLNRLKTFVFDDKKKIAFGVGSVFLVTIIGLLILKK